MFEIDEHLQRFADDVVRALTLDMYDEPDAAGVVLGVRIVQTRLRRGASARQALRRRCRASPRREHGRHIVPIWRA
jgi:hypothetical protein